MTDHQNRVFTDCRQMPSEKQCSLYIAGTEEEVLKVSLRHAVEDHGNTDTPEFREMVRSSLKPE